MRKIFISIFVVAVLLTCSKIISSFLVANARRTKKKPVSPYVLPIRCQIAVREDVPVVINGYAAVKAKTKLQLLSELAGRVVRVSKNFRIGGLVRKGEELFAVETERYENKVNQIEGQIAEVRAQLQILDQEEKNILAIISIQKERLRVKEEQTERARKLYEQGTQSPDELNNAENDLLAQMESLQAQKNAAALLESRRSLQKSKIKILEAQLKDAQLDLERTSYLCPYEARVSNANIEIDEYLEKNRQVGEVLAIDVVELPVAISTSDASRIYRYISQKDPGASYREVLLAMEQYAIPVKISWSDSLNTYSWNGTISRADYRTDPATRMNTFVVQVKNPLAQMTKDTLPLWVGMFCKVEILLGKLEGVYKLPRGAIREGDKVFVVEEGNLAFRKIEVAQVMKDYVAITGLQKGDQVIISPIAQPILGMKVRPVSPEKDEGNLR